MPFRVTGLTRFGIVVAAIATASAAGAATYRTYAVTQGTGSLGATNFLQSSTSNSALQGNVGTANTIIKYPFGVAGVVNAPTSAPFSVGVLGLSSTGYAVAGESTTNQPSIIAFPGGGGIGLAAYSQSSSSSDAVFGDAEGSGVAGDFEAISGAGVVGASSSGIGVEGLSVTSSAVSGLNLQGLFSSTATPVPMTPDQLGVEAESVEGAGLYAFSGLSAPIVAEKGCGQSTIDATLSTANCSGIFLQDDSETGYELEIYNAMAQDYPLYSDSSGNLYLAGHVFDAKGSFSRSPNPNTDELTYSSRETESTVEDFGSARLVDGSARVALSADFQKTIDVNAPYMVFLTPYGDNRGLYIASRTSTGFVVRESQAGRSTMGFDYRIVARPYGARMARLPHESSLHTSPKAPPGVRTAAEYRALAMHRFAAVAEARNRHQVPVVHDLISAGVFHHR